MTSRCPVALFHGRSRRSSDVRALFWAVVLLMLIGSGTAAYAGTLEHLPAPSTAPPSAPLLEDVIPQTLPDARVQEPPASIGTRFSWLALENGLHDAWLSSLRRLHLASETPATAVASTTELAEPPVTSRFKQALMRWRDHAHAETPVHASRSDALASATTPSGVAGATEAPSRFKLADTRVLDEGLTMNDGQVALRARVGARAVEGRSLPAPTPCVAESSVYCEALKVDADRPVPTLDGGYNALRWYQAVQLGFVTRF